MQKMLTVEITASTNRINSKATASFDIEAEEWHSMTAMEQEDMCREWMWDLIDWNFEVAEKR